MTRGGPPGPVAAGETQTGGGHEDWLVLAAAALVGAVLGAVPISDNSELVHVRTGLEIVKHWHVFHHDPYSFTAPGHSWVVQSWFASLTYGLAARAGHHLLMYEQMLVMGTVGVVMAMLAGRHASGWRLIVALGIALAIGTPGWSPRPLMFGLLCLGLTVLVTERRAHPAWLIPIVWVWVNTHATYPLGLAWLAATAVGEAFDTHGWPRDVLVRLGWFCAGLAFALVNPIGPRLLTFPLTALHQKHTFATILEWRSPDFQHRSMPVVLAGIVLLVVVLSRARPRWAQVLPVAGFLGAGLFAQRNLAPLGVVAAPALGLGLATMFGRTSGGWRTDDTRRPRAVEAGVAVVLAAALVVIAGRESVFDFSTYPVAAVERLRSTGRLTGAHRIAATDVVGCYLILRAWPSVRVFIDDRYDMYPQAVADAVDTFNAGQSNLSSMLDRWRIDTAIVSAHSGTTGELADLGWTKAYDDPRWAVFTRPGS